VGQGREKGVLGVDGLGMTLRGVLFSGKMAMGIYGMGKKEYTWV